MRRREFLIGSAAAAAWPITAWAQPSSKRPVIGFLFPSSKEANKRLFDGFQLGMQQSGRLEARDYLLESRYADGDLARLPLLADELVRLKPDVIVSATSSATQAAKQATATISIVGVNLFDPVGLGLVKSEARPGTNVTGNIQYLAGLTGKQLEFTRELLPNVTKIGILANVNNLAFNTLQRGEAEAAAAKLGMSLATAEIRAASEIGSAFQTFVGGRVNAVFVLRDQLFLAMRKEIAAFALASRLPTIYAFRDHVESGGLISYGIDIRENYRRAAFYVDRILKGEKPADLPIEFPTKLELVINLTTAKALGIEVPLFLQQRADELIE